MRWGASQAEKPPIPETGPQRIILLIGNAVDPAVKASFGESEDKPDVEVEQGKLGKQPTLIALTAKLVAP